MRQKESGVSPFVSNLFTSDPLEIKYSITSLFPVIAASEDKVFRHGSIYLRNYLFVLCEVFNSTLGSPIIDG